MEIISFNMSNFLEWKKGVVNRNRHIVYRLLNQPEVERVIAVDFLPFTFKRGIRNYYQNILFGLKGKIIYQDFFNRLVQVSEKLYVFSSVQSLFSPKKVIQKLNQALEKIEKKPKKRVVWSCFPMFKEHFKLSADLFIFDAVDNWLAHPSFKKQQKVLKENYQAISEKSDLIFTVSEELIDFFKEMGRKKDIYWIANGVDYEHFNKETTLIPEDLKKIKRPIIGYVGIIQQRVDLDLLEYLARKNPDKSFVLIGPLWPVYFRKLRRSAVEIKKLKKYKNIHLLGMKSFKETPDYINNFDVAFCPHRLDKFIKSTNSLKILEYLATGKPIVSTPGSGVERFSHLIKIAEDYQGFNQKLEQACQEQDLEKKSQRKDQAKKRDWHYKIEKIIKIINNKINE